MTDKQKVRNLALEKRMELGAIQRSAKSAQILNKIISLPEFNNSSTIMVYLSYKDEVETIGIAAETLKAGKRLLIPYCQKKMIIACQITDIENDVLPGMFGIREPRLDKIRPVPPQEIDLVLVPGLAFDYHGNRIGFGGGYYDRFLPLLRDDAKILGISFFCQLVQEIKPEEHDCKMSLLVTENGVIYPG